MTEAGRLTREPARPRRSPPASDPVTGPGGAPFVSRKRTQGSTHPFGLNKSPQGVDDHVVLRYVGDRDRFGCSCPADRCAKILSHKSQRKHRPAIDDLGDHFCVRRIDKSAHAIHGRSILADPESDGLLPKRHCRLSGSSIPANCTSESFDDCADWDEGPSVLYDGRRIKSLRSAIHGKRRLPYLKDKDRLILRGILLDGCWITIPWVVPASGATDVVHRESGRTRVKHINVHFGCIP